MHNTYSYKLLLISLIVPLSLMTGSCRDPRDKRTPYTTQVVVTLLPKDDKKTAKYLKIQSWTQEGAAESDNEKDEQPKGGRTHTVQLDPHTRVYVSTVTYFKDDDKATHTANLTITYTCKPALISPLCGCAYQYTIEKVEFEGAKEVKILNPQLSSYNESPDVQIYL